MTASPVLNPSHHVNIRSGSSGGLHQVARYQSSRRTFQSQLLADPLNSLRMEEINDQ